MEKTLKLNSNDEAIQIYGSLDENLRYAEKEFDVRISARNHRLRIKGNKSNVDKAHSYFLTRLDEMRGGKPTSKPAEESKDKPRAKKSKSAQQMSAHRSHMSYQHHGRVIMPRGKNQERYVEAIRDHDVVLAVGPAGTGKTYLAMAAAVDALKKKMVSRIILTRPAVEAGESLGFLPGDLQAKVNPYLRPLYDALYDMVSPDEVVKFMDKGMIEVAPIAYMRGRTLSHSFVILDEAQNCTHAQMKMFLTRLGQSSKVVVTGDVTQVDLPQGKKSGLSEAVLILGNISGVKTIQLTAQDVVRHPLVEDIIKAYERFERKSKH